MNTLLLSALLQLITFTGVIKNPEGNPVPSARVTVYGQTTVTNEAGEFSVDLPQAGSYEVIVQYPGCLEERSQVVFQESEPMNIVFEMVSVEVVMIEAIKADEETPVTQTTLTSEQIKTSYFGHDVPVLLSTTPAVVPVSDAGNGIGYSYFRMRGLDQTRINLTINGVPMNDPETQGFFFNNFADMASSLRNIQIQRGVGTSTNGVASYGGSVNFETRELEHKPSFRLSSGVGSFTSRRLTAEFQSGLLINNGKLKDRIAFYGRFSNIQSEGYRNNSGAKIISYFFSAAYFGDKSTLKFNAFGGVAQSKLSYLATESAILDTNRRYNPLSPEEVDLFSQNVYQLQHYYQFNKKLKLLTSAYYNLNSGWFYVKFFGANYADYNMPDNGTQTTTDLIGNFRLDSRFWGLMSFLTYTGDKTTIHGGVHGNMFASDHWMDVPWAQAYPTGYNSKHIAYFNTGYKNEISAFAKVKRQVGKVSLFGDIQLRNATFTYKAKEQPILVEDYKVDDMSWTFLNPRIGASVKTGKYMMSYASVGRTTREPTRVDLFSGSDRAVGVITQDIVKPESVTDIEIGVQWSTPTLYAQVNAYAMEFRNEIAATGELNTFGYLLRKNVDQSFRRGLELEARWKMTKSFSLSHSSAFSYNRIKTFEQFFDVYDDQGNYLESTSVIYKDVSPILTPSVIVNQGVEYNIKGLVSVALLGRYVSKSFLDNTMNNDFITDPYFFADARVSLSLDKLLPGGEHSLVFQVNNLTNTLYSTGGYAYNYLVRNAGNDTNTGINYYYPSATRNYFLTLNLKF